MSLEKMYQEKLLDHYKNSPYKGTLAYFTCSSGVYNPSCGDAVSLQMVIENNIIKQAKFEGKGCVISVACTSLLIEKIIGLSCNQVDTIDVATITSLIGISLGPTRLRCALLSLDALQAAMKNYRERVC